MNDHELYALAVLVQARTADRETENAERESRQMAPAYTEDIPFPERDKLEAELKRRGII